MTQTREWTECGDDMAGCPGLWLWACGRSGPARRTPLAAPADVTAALDDYEDRYAGGKRAWWRVSRDGQTFNSGSR